MRLAYAVILTMFAAFTLTESQARGGNVLLPPDDGSSASTPNLGFMPSESSSVEPLPVPKTTPAVTPPPATPEPAAPTPTPTPTPAPTPQPTPPQQAPANYLTISLTQSSYWKPYDIANVSSQLGIPRGLVTSECRLGISGMLITNQGAVAVDSNQSPTINVPYEGYVTNASLTTYAACTSAPQPAPSTYIQRIGDKFSVSLSSAFCMPPAPFAGTIRQLWITHGVNGSDSCAYQ